MVWNDPLCKKSLLVVVCGGWQTKFSVSPGPGLWRLVLGPFGPDLGPDLDPTWDLDLSLTKSFLVSSEWQSKFSVWPRSRSLSFVLGPELDKIRVTALARGI